MYLEFEYNMFMRTNYNTLKMSVYIVLFLLFLIGCNKNDPFKEGVKSYRNGKYNKAIKLLNKELIKHPNNKNAYYERGNSKAALGNYEEAIKDITEAIKLDSHPAFLSNRSVMHLKIGNYRDALYDATQAIFKNDTFANAYNNRAGAYYKLERLDSAILDYTKAISLEPKNPNTYFNRAKVYQEKGQIEMACSDWEVVHDMGYRSQSISFIKSYCR
mgnify:CR=1 FL=1